MVSTILDLIKPKQPAESRDILPFDRSGSSSRNESFESVLKTELDKPETREITATESYGVVLNETSSKKEESPREASRTREESLPRESERKEAGKRENIDDKNEPSRNKTALNDGRNAQDQEKSPARDEKLLQKGTIPAAIKHEGWPSREKETQLKKSSGTSGAEAFLPAAFNAVFEKPRVRNQVPKEIQQEKNPDKSGHGTFINDVKTFRNADPLMKKNAASLDSIKDKAQSLNPPVQIAQKNQPNGKLQKKESVQDKRDETIPAENRPAFQKTQISTAVQSSSYEGESSRPGREKHQDAQQNLQFQARETGRNSIQRTAHEVPGQICALFQENLDRIMESARVVVRDGRNASLSLRLNPAELGSVTVNLGLEHGVLNAKFLVDNADVRDAVAANMDGILQELEQSGISVGEFQVNVRDDRAFQRQDDKAFSPFFQNAGRRETADSSYSYASLPLHEGGINYVI